jgi:hypothetical protein
MGLSAAVIFVSVLDRCPLRQVCRPDTGGMFMLRRSTGHEFSRDVHRLMLHNFLLWEV